MDKYECMSRIRQEMIGSQSAYLTGRILYRFSNRVFSHAPEVLARYEIDRKCPILGDVTIISATGTQEVVQIARYALDKGLRVHAIVCNPKSELHRSCSRHEMCSESVVRAINEPPTVNTATYGRMIQAVTGEELVKILRTVRSLEEPLRPYKSYKAFTVIFPDSMPEVAAMVDWKLRGEKIGRCIGTMSVCLTNFMHGAGVTDAKNELYLE
jgi:hypothetical protein